MNALEKMTDASETHRAAIGWGSIAVGIFVFAALAQISYTVTYNRDNILANETLVRRNHMALEQAFHDMVRLKDRPVIVYAISRGKSVNGILMNWPQSAEDLLGWTRAKINERGLNCIFPERYRKQHAARIATVAAGGRITSEPKQIETYAMHEDGREIPVTLTVWGAHSVEGISTLSAVIKPREGE